MFTQSITLEHEVRTFRKERVKYYLSQESDGEDYKQFLLLHLIPDSFQDSSYNQPMFVLQKRGHQISKLFHTIGVSYHQPIIEGMRYTKINDKTECRIYNNGIVECFVPLSRLYIGSGNDRNKEQFLCEKDLWDNIISPVLACYHPFISKYFSAQRFFAGISIIGCKGISTPQESFQVSESKIDRNDLECNPIIFENYGNQDDFKHSVQQLELEYLLSLGIKNQSRVGELIEAIYK